MSPVQISAMSIFSVAALLLMVGNAILDINMFASVYFFEYSCGGLAINVRYAIPQALLKLAHHRRYWHIGVFYENIIDKMYQADYEASFRCKTPWRVAQ